MLTQKIKVSIYQRFFPFSYHPRMQITYGRNDISLLVSTAAGIDFRNKLHVGCNISSAQA